MKILCFEEETHRRDFEKDFGATGELPRSGALGMAFLLHALATLASAFGVSLATLGLASAIGLLPCSFLKGQCVVGQI